MFFLGWRALVLKDFLEGKKRFHTFFSPFFGRGDVEFGLRIILTGLPLGSSLELRSRILREFVRSCLWVVVIDMSTMLIPSLMFLGRLALEAMWALIAVREVSSGSRLTACAERAKREIKSSELGMVRIGSFEFYL
jgi:hypothetical protein